MAEAPNTEIEQQGAIPPGEISPDNQREDDTPTDDQLWDKVREDRTQEFAPELPATPPPDVAESTKKLLEEIDRLKEAVAKQGTEVGTVKQHISRVNGLFGSMKQRVEKMAPVVDHVRTQRAAEEREAREAEERKRVELREKAAEFAGPEMLEYLDAVLPKPDAKPPAEKPATPQADDKPTAEELLQIADLQRQLSDEVPGWMKIRDSAEFKTWAKAQPPAVQDIMQNSLDVQESAGVFKAFLKQQDEAAKVAQVEKERQERLRRGNLPTGRGTTPAGNDDTGDLWDKVTRDRAKERQSA